MLKIGTDIVAISRIAKLIKKYDEKFLHRILRKSEIENFTKPESIAGVFAAKEAISKALGVGIGAKFSFKDAKIYKDKFGAPHFKIRKKIKRKFKIKNIALSITHDNGVAIAIVAVKTK